MFLFIYSVAYQWEADTILIEHGGTVLIINETDMFKKDAPSPVDKNYVSSDWLIQRSIHVNSEDRPIHCSAELPGGGGLGRFNSSFFSDPPN